MRYQQILWLGRGLEQIVTDLAFFAKMMQIIILLKVIFIYDI